MIRGRAARPGTGQAPDRGHPAAATARRNRPPARGKPMDRDFRATPEWASIERFYRAVLAPGGGSAEGATVPGTPGGGGPAGPAPAAGHEPPGHVFSGRGLCGRADGDALYFIGQSHDRGLAGGVSSHLCRVSRATGRIERLNAVETRQIRLAPDGLRLAVATAAEARTDAVTVLGPETDATVRLPGRIEAVDWSADGRRLLMVVAGRGADLAGIHGGHTQEAEARTADWLPDVRTDQGSELWRRIWVWDLAGAPRPLTSPPLNTWEASWLGSGHIAAAVSDHHGEGSWYRVRLVLIDAETGAVTEAVVPADQLGVPRGSPDGRRVAFVTALCSDRGLVAGTLSILDRTSGRVTAMPTEGVDVTSIEWRSATVLHLAGLRDCETVNADLDLATGRLSILWASEHLTHGEWAPSAAPIGIAGSLFVAEGYGEAPALVQAEAGRVTVLASLAAPTAAAAMAECGTIAPFRWQARDGLPISGWLVSPTGASAAGPLLLDVHGGPISAHRNRWMARLRATPLLVAAGWRVLMPNPRGSTGKGDGFVRRVKGDMGGADAEDILAAVDALVAAGLADGDRVAVTGTSYGGFMSAWLPTLTDRIAAAVPISPVGDWMSQHRTTQIPEFDALMLDGSPWSPGGAYFDRSPAFFRQRKPVPTLVMAGGLDRSTPPGQAQECHFAAVASGAPSTLLTYPKAGHSLRSYPEYFDSAARVLHWLAAHVAPTATPPTAAASTGSAETAPAAAQKPRSETPS